MDCFKHTPHTSKSGIRIAKHTEAQQIYKCQCAREYLTFSALYLHVSLKHGQRLSTRRIEGNHKIEKINNKTIVTYFWQESQNITGNQYNNQLKHQKDISKQVELQKNQPKIMIISQYLEYLQRNSLFQEMPYSIYQTVMNSFIGYFNCIDELTPDLCPSKAEDKDVTEYFNQFSMYYMPLVEKKMAIDVKRVVRILFSFYLWLKENKYTRMELLCHRFYEGSQQQ